MVNILLPTLVIVSCWSSIAGKVFYTAAVFEHARLGSQHDPVKYVIQTNLEFYKRAAEVAKTKGVDIIAFPEYGIFFSGDRKKVKPFLEEAPDPRITLSNPCNEKDSYNNRPILYTLSCLAKNNSMFVVANMGDIIQSCIGHPNCSVDGVWQFNTNVVFDRNGTLVMKYHKEHLFMESGMDVPQEVQNVTFKTDFGTFATFICFDIIFSRMSQITRRLDVEGVILPTMWVDMLPLMTSIQVWESWAVGNDATLIAANGQIPGQFSVGSGIFNGPDGALSYTFNPDGISKLIVTKVPKRSHKGSISNKPSITAITQNGTWDYTEDGKNVPEYCSENLLDNVEDINNELRCLQRNTSKHTLVQLIETSGLVSACNKGMCCSLKYSMKNNFSEEFFLGVINATYNAFHSCSYSMGQNERMSQQNE